jgi:hypothetical protein
LVIGKALYPGYILLLDMGWAPQFPLIWDKTGFNNVFPVYTVIHFLTLIVPSWVVQKALLLFMMFILFAIPWRYLPYITHPYARAFAVGVFALNPFVYARILSGQWFHVIGYAFLPFVLYALVEVVRVQTRRAIARLAITLLAVGLFSIHFLYLSIIISCIWMIKHALYSWWNKDTLSAKRILFASFITSMFFIVCSSYWILPAMVREAPIEARFDERHFTVFASASNRSIPVMHNVAVLGGFWGEKMAWKYFFVFPQDKELFWIASIFIFLFIILGIRYILSDTRMRYGGIIICTIGVLSYITALGASITPFRGFNLFLYEHVPFWNGLRDSNKIVGILALVYSVCAGLGVQSFLLKTKETLSKSKYPSSTLEEIISILLLIIPMTFGMYMWGGLHNQLKPVYYPYEWREAKAILDHLPPDVKILVLPWNSYLSLPFTNNQLVANPLPSYFGTERVVVSRDVGIGAIHDQEVDEKYRTLDNLITHAYMIKPEELMETLHGYSIEGILILTNPLIDRSEEGLTSWDDFFGGGGSEMSSSTSTGEMEKTWVELLPKNIIKKSFGNSLNLLILQE